MSECPVCTSDLSMSNYPRVMASGLGFCEDCVDALPVYALEPVSRLLQERYEKDKKLTAMTEKYEALSAQTTNWICEKCGNPRFRAP